MITSGQITKFLGEKTPPLNGGLLEDFHDMLVGARNELERLEKENNDLRRKLRFSEPIV